MRSAVRDLNNDLNSLLSRVSNPGFPGSLILLFRDLLFCRVHRRSVGSGYLSYLVYSDDLFDGRVCDF